MFNSILLNLIHSGQCGGLLYLYFHVRKIFIGQCDQIVIFLALLLIMMYCRYLIQRENRNDS